MKAVLMSIRSKWWEKITSDEKWDEIRKTKPKLGSPFKVYVYETKGITETPFVDEDGHEIFKGRGQVVGEFVCNRFVFLDAYYDSNGNRHLCNTAFIKSCVPDDELFDYLYGKHGYKHGGWAWHISDLVIYDKPKELGTFYQKCKSYDKDEWDIDNLDCIECRNPCGNGGKLYLKRPPQSWCYVEELKER